ncbi:MAG: hypothetical protein LAT84_02370 [Balneolia bacterium]|nr:hypothetical protein [Balneolia bacterium]
MGTHQKTPAGTGTAAKTDSSARQAPEWENIRSKGRIRYTLVQGGLLAVIVMMWIYIWRAITLGTLPIIRAETLLTELFIALCISLPVYAFVMWPLNERFYARSVNGNEEGDRGL